MSSPSICGYNIAIYRYIHKHAVLVYHTRFLSAVLVILHVWTVHLFHMALLVFVVNPTLALYSMAMWAQDSQLRAYRAAELEIQ